MPQAKILMLSFSCFFFCMGFLFVLGACLQWGWLVDPDESFSRFYSQAWIKKIFGKKILTAYTIFIGILFMIISSNWIVAALKMPDENWSF